MRVTAKAQRSDGWWAVEVPEVPGVFTQARRLDQVPDMVRDAVALVAEVDPADVEVDVVPHTSHDELVQQVLAARAEAEAAAARVAELSRATTRKLVDAGFTVRDAGQLLGVSAQRVSQILDEAKVRARAEERLARAVKEVTDARALSKVVPAGRSVKGKVGTRSASVKSKPRVSR